MRYAVVFKAYFWDEFVHRQALRCAAAAGSGDFFVSVDETNRLIGDIPFERVVRTSNDALVAAGFANRFETGSLIWWNPDYVHYQFQELYPDYDYYVFVEYDVVIKGGLETPVRKAAAGLADLVALPVPMPVEQWFWSLFHRQTYPLNELKGSLICLSIFSRRALCMLAARRREMAADGRTKYWPSAEAFVPTEIRRAQFVYRRLDELGDVSGYDWFPPLLEDDMAGADSPAVHGRSEFFHPVLDRKRFIASTLKSTTNLRHFFNPNSRMRRSLAAFPREEYAPLLAAAALARMKVNIAERRARLRARLRQALGRLIARGGNPLAPASGSD